MKLLLSLVAVALLCGASAPGHHGHPVSWKFYTVDDFAYKNTVLTGINNLGKVTAYSYSGTINGPIAALVAEPSYADWENINFPSWQHCVASGLSNSFIQVGHCSAYSTNGKVTTFGYVRDHGAYTPYQSFNEFLGENKINCPPPDIRTGHCHSKGVDKDPLIVGFFLGDEYSPFEYDFDHQTMTPFTPPGAFSAVATGINGKGDVVGYMTDASGEHKSWAYENVYDKYYEFAYPGAVRTSALAVNWQDNIVGCMLDASGKRHGFIYSEPFGSKPVWQIINEPKATGDTCINSINDPDVFVGDYFANGVMHGFEAVPTSLPNWKLDYAGN